MKKLKVLESLRGLAALYVFLGHFALAMVLKKQSHLGFFFRFGQEAVMLFFLLSGFVIYYSSQKHKDTRFKDYFIRRFKRIYPIFLLSLLISYLCLALVNHSFIHVNNAQLAGNVFLLQDFKGGKPGTLFETFAGNLPLWSLSYEWWFYMMFFPVFYYVPTQKQNVLVFALSFCGFLTYWLLPNQISLFLMYFIIWWTGIEVAKVYCSGKRPSLQNLATPALFLSVMTAMQAAAVIIWNMHKYPLSFGIHPILELRHFAFSWIILLIALIMPPRVWKGFARLIEPFALLAPISYALYVLHYPVAIRSHIFDHVTFLPLRWAACILLAFLVAWLAEIPYQSQANKLISAFTNRRQPIHAAE